MSLGKSISKCICFFEIGCSNVRVLNTFKSMDQKEITYLFNEKKSIEVVCEFCKTKRVYSEQDLK